jgi:hypothetical protein
MRIHYNYQKYHKTCLEVRLLIVRLAEGINNKKSIEKKEDINYNTCHY